MNRRALGSEKEREACRYLERKGYRILATNYWCRGAELDIVARDGGVLVFVEVKYRRSPKFGSGLCAISPKKIRSITRCARYYIYRERIPPNMPMRFDVVAMDENGVTHLEHAFEAIFDAGGAAL